MERELPIIKKAASIARQTQELIAKMSHGHEDNPDFTIPMPEGYSIVKVGVFIYDEEIKSYMNMLWSDGILKDDFLQKNGGGQ